ncbi:hypothetical protein BCL57_001362 [Agromyces flavus]|uniref:Uncharacterized protein n=2 Tax=Agromyces flavus TaxID=589382 RepID=A0A1H1ZR47_9MICO|nr:hypothetical protein [Agromyces flavus]MCP2367208.1 hypothetical protein [Agromyces flavus]GGI46187.1 hypothetical protein GCM10010932_13340 [Agromyces flavus]SDT35872.1 hypothetical protein SAMN04489721_3287 [Agromyces flavus]
MRVAVAVRPRPLLRAALVGSGLAAAWVVVSLVGSPASASAEERPDGLLGTVGSVVGVVDGTLDAVVDEVVDEVVEPVVGAVSPSAVEAVEVFAPEPARPIVDAVPVMVDETTDAANGTIDVVDVVVADAVSGVGSTVGDLAGSAPVGGIVHAVDRVVGSAPVVGPVLGDDTLGGLLGPVADLADDTLDVVVGELPTLPADGVLPSLPEPGIGPEASAPLPGDGAVSAVADDTPSAIVVAPVDAWTLQAHDPAPPGAPAPLGAIAPTSSSPAHGSPLGSGTPPGGSASAGSGSGLGSGADATLAAHALDARASLVLGSVDDALPSSPVFETDTTPD